METGKIRQFTDLIVWQKAHDLVVLIYKVTEDFPKSEMFGLCSQMRRAAVSISSNIAEGFSRQSYKEKIQFYSMSHGSLTEVQNQVIISKDLNYLDPAIFDTLLQHIETVHKLLNALIKKSRTF